MNTRIVSTIAKELSSTKAINEKQVEAAISLLDEGATVPFISRYRKEVTGGLDDTQLRLLEERLKYLRELEQRRETILKSIEEQGKLSDELATSIHAAETKTTLEDLYLPFKPKRRTKATIAIESGLEPLADALYDNQDLVPEDEAKKYVNDSEENPVADVKAALEGARYILMDRFSEDAALIAKARITLRKTAISWPKSRKTRNRKAQNSPIILITRKLFESSFAPCTGYFQGEKRRHFVCHSGRSSAGRVRIHQANAAPLRENGRCALEHQT